MKAVVFHGVGDIRLDDVEEPKIQEPTDAIVRLTSSAICGTDLHMVRGTMAGMVPGTILGHEGAGVVEEVGPQVRNLNVWDRVVIHRPSAAGTACSVAGASTPSATTPTPTVCRPRRLSSVGRSPRDPSTGCRPSMPGYPTPTSDRSSCPSRSPTSRPYSSPTSSRPDISAPIW